MKTPVFVPIKLNSERVPGKNFRILNGKKLYEYILEHILEANCFDDIYVDTNSPEIVEWTQGKNISIIERKPELATNAANGNDLLLHQFEMFPDYDFYFQLFATAPYLQSTTIKKCFEILTSSEEFDSCFTAVAHQGFFWLNNNPINYRPGVLPRSQDLMPVIEETTGLYGISKNALQKYHCRIGGKPYIHVVNKYEAVDINNEEDLKIAEAIGKIIYHLG